MKNLTADPGELKLEDTWKETRAIYLLGWTPAILGIMLEVSLAGYLLLT